MNHGTLPERWTLRGRQVPEVPQVPKFRSSLVPGFHGSIPRCYSPHNYPLEGIIRLIDEASGDDLGEISDEDVQFLIDQLEEEHAADTAYYINQDTVTLLRTNGASQELLALLDRALNRTGEAEVRWTDA